jgi:hypothetical protein
VVEISPAITRFIPHIALSGLEKLKIASILGVKFDLFFMFIDSELGTTPAHYQPMQCVGPHLRAGERSDRAADWHFEAYGRYPKRFAFLRCSVCWPVWALGNRAIVRLDFAVFCPTAIILT